MKKITINLFIIFFIALLSFSLVIAEQPKIEPPTFLEKIINIFRINQFTIVGVDRGCDVTPKCLSNPYIPSTATYNHCEWKILTGGANKGFTITKADIKCPSGHGLYDIYANGVPKIEMKDEVSFTCSGSNTECTVELYCCPNDCDVGGSCASGSSCITKNAVDSYMPLKDANNNIISSYKYCSSICTGSSKTCYRIGSSNTCESSTYPCSYATYQTIIDTNCASGAGSFIYGSLSACNSAISTPTCPSGQTKCSDGICKADCGEIIPSLICSDNGGKCRSYSCLNNEVDESNKYSCDEWYNLLNKICCIPKKETIPTSTKQIGEICSNDLECETKHCDKTKWYSLSQTCQPIPWSESKKIAYTKETISTMTNQNLLGLACIENSQCLAPDTNYTAKCIVLSKLREDGTISNSKSFLDSAKITINGVIAGSSIGALGGLVTCVAGVGGTTLVVIASGGFATPILIPAVASCSVLIGGGALIGAGTGYTATQIYIGATNKDALVKAIQAEDENSVGLCVAERTGIGGLCQIAEKLAFINFTENKCTNGIIIGVIILFLIILLIR